MRYKAINLKKPFKRPIRRSFIYCKAKISNHHQVMAEKSSHPAKSDPSALYQSKMPSLSSLFESQQLWVATPYVMASIRPCKLIQILSP
jgi:hypothetical protein